ncbi:MAG TPA: cytochrome c maturation protein CcmE [Anseongella sp.]|nr:cytochrome c maturation protein CcmE [Anseongella sp.]
MKRSHIVGIVLIAVAIGVIISTYADTSTYADFTRAGKTGDEIHVVGKLAAEKPLFYDPVKDANYFSFYMKDEDGVECKVVFNGTKPQDFERSEQIVLVGRMKGEEFHASKILMKCPSKYTEDQIEMKEFSAEANG